MSGAAPGPAAEAICALLQRKGEGGAHLGELDPVRQGARLQIVRPGFSVSPCCIERGADPSRDDLEQATGARILVPEAFLLRFPDQRVGSS